MDNVVTILNNYGVLGVQMLKAAVSKVSATGNTEASISFEVTSKEDSDTLKIFAREFFSTLETGRGPRKSSTEGGFQDGLEEWMRARGIGSELSDKKRKQLAAFFRWRINKEGDATYKKGGRQVYSNDLEKYIEALKEALKKDFVLSFRNNLKSALGHDQSTT